jgi:hypothetical protein
MSLHRRAAKRDANEYDIVDAFRAAGCSVEFLSRRGCPDLLIGCCGRDMLVEVKGYAGQLTDEQIEWHRAWRGSVPVIVRSVDDVLALVQRVRLGRSA